jgi:hypothetical protein
MAMSYVKSQADLDSFLEFSQHQLDTSDFDMHHPVLERLGQDCDDESKIWLTFLYMAFYNEASAWSSFVDAGREPAPLNFFYPVDVQRRNLRTALSMHQHFDSLLSRARYHGGFREMLTHNLTGKPVEDWNILVNNVQSHWGNGRWASYTTAETLQKINAIPVTVADIGIHRSTGPLFGITRIFGHGDPDYHEECAVELLEIMKASLILRVPHLDDGHIDLGVVESLLCDYAGLVKGTFYAGRNIDRIMDRTDRVTAKRPDASVAEIWDMRRDVIPSKYRGEDNGWRGIDKWRLRIFRDTGRILAPDEER